MFCQFGNLRTADIRRDVRDVPRRTRPHCKLHVRIRHDSTDSSVTISNGVSIVGRILPLFFAQRLGPINVLTVAACVSGTIQMMWTLARSTAGILAYDAIYGLTSGGYGAALNPGAASFAPHTNQAGLYLGMCFFVTSWFWLAGTPIAAQLIDKYSYFAASMFTGGVVLTGSILLCVSRTVRAKQVGTQWV